VTGAPQRKPSSRPLGQSAPRHCPEAEYADLVGRQPLSTQWREKHLAFHRRFVRAYPDLAAWPSQPLRQRLGWRGPEGQNRRSGPGEGTDATACWVNFNARHYLTYLALTGRLRLDWGWLLGIGVLKPWLVADQIGLPLSTQAADLQERLIALGHVRDKDSFRLSWALTRLVLHRADPDLAAVTFEDVEEMRQVIKDLDQVPGIGEVIDPARLPGLRSAWGTSAYRAGLALFHGGVTNRLPVPYRGLPRPLLSSRPRIAAVMDRFVAERALVLRPESMTSLRGGMRRFGLWLDAERPDVESLAELTRADMVAFMEAVRQLRKIKRPDEPVSPAYRADIISVIAVFFRLVLERHRVGAPQRLGHVEELIKRGAPLLHRPGSGGRVLVNRPAGAKPGNDPSAAGRGDRRERVGEPEGHVHGRNERRGPDPHPAGHRGRHRKGHNRLDDPAVDRGPGAVTVFGQLVDSGLILGVQNALEDPHAVVSDRLG